MATTLIGAAPGRVTSYPEFELGQVANIETAEYVYTQAANTAISANSAFLLDFNNTGHLLTADNALLNSRIGVSTENPSKGHYFWAQVRGTAQVLVAAGVLKRTGLYPGDSGGILTSTSGDNYINGIATIEDNGLAVSAVLCRLNNPRVELTPGTGGGTGGISTTQARALISDWAETSNTDAIPADKLTNAPSGNGGGAITQATETALGGARGATALQAIAASGTTILAWTNNRIRQLIAVALPTMTQTDITNSTTGRKAVTGALIASNSGGNGGGNGGGGTPTVTVTPERTLLGVRTSIPAATDTLIAFDPVLVTPGSTLIFEGYPSSTSDTLRAYADIDSDSYLKLTEDSDGTPFGGAAVALYYKEIDDTSASANVIDELRIWRANNGCYLGTRTSDAFIEVYVKQLVVAVS